MTEDVNKVRYIEIAPENTGQRIDNFLLSQLKGVPKSHIYRVIRKGEVRLNKKRVKPHQRLQQGDLLRIPPIRVASAQIPPKPSEQLTTLLLASTLYQNDDILVINKPSGIAVHGGSGVKLGLIEALRQITPELSQLELVHRLDRATSGCLVIAKNSFILKYLHKELRARRVTKSYHALVAGHWPAHVDKIEAPLRKNALRSGERLVFVQQEGQPSLTRFKILRQYSQSTLMLAMPITGRTHQIRVHAQHCGHSIIGDEKYGETGLNQQMRKLGFKRLCLHAAEICFQLPGQTKPITVKAPLDSQFEDALAALK